MDRRKWRIYLSLHESRNKNLAYHCDKYPNQTHPTHPHQRCLPPAEDIDLLLYDGLDSPYLLLLAVAFTERQIDPHRVHHRLDRQRSRLIRLGRRLYSQCLLQSRRLTQHPNLLQPGMLGGVAADERPDDGRIRPHLHDSVPDGDRMLSALRPVRIHLRRASAQCKSTDNKNCNKLFHTPCCSSAILSCRTSSLSWAFSAHSLSTEAFSSPFSRRTATISALTAVMSERSLRFSDECRSMDA